MSVIDYIRLRTRPSSSWAYAYMKLRPVKGAHVRDVIKIYFGGPPQLCHFGGPPLSF